MDLLMNCGYPLLGLCVSIFYAVRAAWITEKAHRFERLHQIWFNFAGSALGWLIGYWVLRRFGGSQNSLGVIEFLLMIVAALGIVGYLPQTLNAIPGLLNYLSSLAKSKLEGSLPRSDAVTNQG